MIVVSSANSALVTTTPFVSELPLSHTPVPAKDSPWHPPPSYAHLVTPLSFPPLLCLSHHCLVVDIEEHRRRGTPLSQPPLRYPPVTQPLPSLHSILRRLVEAFQGLHKPPLQAVPLQELPHRLPVHPWVGFSEFEQSGLWPLCLWPCLPCCLLIFSYNPPYPLASSPLSAPQSAVDLPLLNLAWFSSSSPIRSAHHAVLFAITLANTLLAIANRTTPL